MPVCGGTPRRSISRATPQDLDHRSKMKEVVRSSAKDSALEKLDQMRDNPGGGELDPAEDVRRSCKKNSPSVLSCKGKRTRDGCDRGSEVGTVNSGLYGEWPVPPRKPKKSGRRGSCEKDFVATL